MHRRTLYLGKQNRPCHQHFINTEVSGPREAPWRTLGIEPSPQLFCSYSAQSASARQTSSLGCHFLSSPRLGPGQVVRLVARWGRHLWLYLCHSFGFLEGTDNHFIKGYMTWGLGSKGTGPQRNPWACIDVKVLLTEKEGSVTEPGFLFLIPGLPSEGMAGQVAGGTAGPAKGRLTRTEVCTCQAQFGCRAFAHTRSVYHKIPLTSIFAFFPGISVSEMFQAFKKRWPEKAGFRIERSAD